SWFIIFFFFQAEDGIRDFHVTGVQTCALPISREFENKSFKNPPLQEIMLRLATFGEGSDQLYSSLDFSTVEFHPELATYQNYGRSEERRVGKECRYRWSPYQ